MPNFSGMGPNGAGPMTGWGMGPCGGAQAYGYGRGMSYGAGFGRGRGMGMGRGLGWFAVGNGREDSASATASVRSTLEERKALLCAELNRTEALLKKNDSARTASANGNDGK